MRYTFIGQMIYETPPRVYIPHGSLPLVFNDYMFKDEKVEDCAERAQQLLGSQAIVSSTIDTNKERSARKLVILYDLSVLYKLCS